MKPFNRLLFAFVIGLLLIGGSLALLTFTPTTPAGTEEQVPVDPDDPTITWINEEPLQQSDFSRAQAINKVMSELTGTPIDNDATALQQLINKQLVLQAARKAGFTVSEAETAEALQQFLAAQGQSQEKLDAALNKAGISPQEFTSCFGELLTAQNFAAAQSQAQGLTVAQYLAQLQTRAGIPVAQTLPTPTTLPSPTPPPNPSPTATPTTADTPPIQIANRGIETGQVAPDFSLSRLDNPQGPPLTWTDMQGHPTVISFWVSWCSHCQAQTPILIDGFNRYQDLGINFIGINVREDIPTAQTYVSAHQIPYPILLDLDGSTAGSYQLPGYPTTYFLDATGRIVTRHIGELQPADLDNYIAQLLEQTSP